MFRRGANRASLDALCELFSRFPANATSIPKSSSIASTSSSPMRTTMKSMVLVMQQQHQHKRRISSWLFTPSSSSVATSFSPDNKRERDTFSRGRCCYYSTKTKRTWTKRRSLSAAKNKKLPPPFSETTTYKIRKPKKGEELAREPFFANVIVERLPVVESLPEEWEKEYEDWSREYNEQFQKIMPDELIAAKVPVESTEGEEGEAGTLEQFQPASVETNEEDNVKTTNRKLREFLFLVVKEKGKETWGFPRAERKDDWTMRLTAENAVEKAFKNAKMFKGFVGKKKSSDSSDSSNGDEEEEDFSEYREGGGLEYQMVGNCPMAHYALEDGTNFYHRATYLDGEVALSSSVDDFAWVTKEEMKSYISDESEYALFLRMV